VCSVDKSEQIGLNWWRTDPTLGGKRQTDGVGAGDVARLEARIAQLERQLKTKGG